MTPRRGPVAGDTGHLANQSWSPIAGEHLSEFLDHAADCATCRATIEAKRPPTDLCREGRQLGELAQMSILLATLEAPLHG